MLFLRRFSLLLCVVLCLPVLGWAKTSNFGVLVMAHGGSPTWNKTVTGIVHDAEIPYPTRIFFGMGANKDEASNLQDQVNALQDAGVHTIIVVPLLVSSYSEVYRQWRYLLGVDVQPGFNVPLFPIEKRAEIQFSDPLNDDPIVALVLLDRAREISQNPEQEAVLLVAHGPNDNSDNAKWTAMLRRLSNVIQQRGHFKSVDGMTLRDDAPDEVRSAAIEKMRDRVEELDQAGLKVLVIPFLIAPGGIENKVGIALKGLDYSLNAKVLLPDHRISQWIRSKVP